MVFVIRRLLQAPFLVLDMSFLVFAGIFAVGNPVDILIDPDATRAERARLIVQLGLDRPFHGQYFIFLGNLLQGDFGNSFVYNRPAPDSAHWTISLPARKRCCNGARHARAARWNCTPGKS